MKGFGAKFVGSSHGNGWARRYGSASWNHCNESKCKLMHYHGML